MDIFFVVIPLFLLLFFPHILFFLFFFIFCYFFSRKMKLWTSPWVSCLVILILCFGSECGIVRKKGRSKRELVRIREAKATIPGACATRLPRGKRSLPGLERRVLRQRRRSSQAEGNSPDRGKAVYFTGRGDQLRLKPGVEIPRGNFTVEMWIKPEGGQRSPTVIAGRLLYSTSSILSSAQLLLLVKLQTEERMEDKHANLQRFIPVYLTKQHAVSAS